MKIQSQAQILEAAQLITANVRKDAALQKQLAAHGFSPKRMQEGNGLINAAEMHQQTQIDHYDQKWAIGRQLSTDIKTVCTTFRDHARVVKTAFRHDPITLQTLKVKAISTNQWKCLKEAIYFYGQLNNHVTTVAAYGLTAEVIAQSRAAAEAVLAMKSDRAHSKGMAEDSTQSKQKAFQALRAWIMDFRRTARLAFHDNPQLLEVFGIPVSSRVKG